MNRQRRRRRLHGTPWWWRDTAPPAILPCIETRWVAGMRYIRTWDVDGMYIVQISPGKHVQSAGRQP